MKRTLLWCVALASSLPSVTAVAETPVVVTQRPRDLMIPMDLEPLAVPFVNSNKIYLNNCKPNGCVVRPGNPSSIDGSGFQGTWQISSQRTLTASTLSDADWGKVVACVKDVFSPFGVEITTDNPTPSPHFEIMIAGSPGDIGLPSGVGGVSAFTCETYISNSLVFDFQKVWGNDIEEICSTAAQEIAHSFALDHVTDPSDPLTYNPYSGRRYFKDAQVQCGSDCQGGQSPSGLTCTGLNGQAHVCSCTNQNTQNSVQTIKALFGAGAPTPPMVKIISPKLGEAVQAGFAIQADITDAQGIGMAELRIDGNLVKSNLSSPYGDFTAPATLADGTHTVEVRGVDIYGAATKSTVQIVIGDPCNNSSDCPKDTDACIGGRCVAGPNATGGLGATCTSNPDCAGGQCLADDKGEKHCVENCVLDKHQCPSDFGCLDAGNGLGVCWPGYDDGGGCAAGSGPGAPIGFSLAFAALLFARRRRACK